MGIKRIEHLEDKTVFYIEEPRRYGEPDVNRIVVVPHDPEYRKRLPIMDENATAESHLHSKDKTIVSEVPLVGLLAFIISNDDDRYGDWSSNTYSSDAHSVHGPYLVIPAQQAESHAGEPADEKNLIATLPYSQTIEHVVESFDHILSAGACTAADLRALSPRKFEELIAEIWNRLAYKVELTTQTRDGGRDVIAVRGSESDLKILIECKRYSALNKVTVAVVRALYGVKTHELATKAILATTSTFTADAQLFLESHRWELEGRDYEGVLKWLRRARLTRHSGSGLWIPE